MELLPLLFTIALGAIGAQVLYTVVNRLFFDKLARFPGPPLAKWTDLAQLAYLYSERHETPSIRLHETYGRAVRVAPNKVYFSDPQAANEIYGLSSGLRKSDFYPVNAVTANGVPVENVFVTQNVEYHDRIKRSVFKAFANTAKQERPVDETVAEFLDEMRKRTPVDKPEGAVIDVGEWTNYFAMDAINRIVYDEPTGFVRAGSDFNGMIATTAIFVIYGFYAGMAPWLDKIFLKNPLLLLLQKFGVIPSDAPAVVGALARQRDRLEAAKKAGSFKAEHGDMLDTFIEASIEKPDVMTEAEILKVGVVVILAGGDTTATLMCELFYRLCMNPEVLKKLNKEFDEAPSPITFAQARKLPYFDVCVLEAKRLNPVLRMTAERVVPEGGMTISGVQLPGGTVVGANSFPVGRDKELYGNDADVFRPERWLEADAQHRRQMERSLPIFGFGRYECPGKHIAMMEIMKLFPAFFREFTLEDAGFSDEMYPSMGSIARPTNVKLRVKRRVAV